MGNPPPDRRKAAAHAGRPSLAEVAAEAGVSPSTASAALNATRAVRAETRERVIRAAERLGYARTRDARTRGVRARTGRTGVVGLVIDGIAATPFAGRLIQGAQEEARARGFLLLVVDTAGDPQLEASHLRALAERSVDGIVLARGIHQEVERPATIGDLPVVLAGAVPAAGWAVPAVAPDEHEVAALAVGHLFAAGHQRIAFITADAATPATRGRYAGFRAAAEWAGLYDTHAVVERASPDASGGRRVARRLLDHPAGERPTAIFCFNDQVAMGVYQAADALGLDVPRDCSVLGVDDLEVVAAALDPGLTTIALPHREIGRRATSLLLEHIEGRSADVAGPLLLPCDLVERRSVAPPRRMFAWLNRR